MGKVQVQAYLTVNSWKYLGDEDCLTIRKISNENIGRHFSYEPIILTSLTEAIQHSNKNQQPQYTPPYQLGNIFAYKQNTQINSNLRHSYQYLYYQKQIDSNTDNYISISMSMEQLYNYTHTRQQPLLFHLDRYIQIKSQTPQRLMLSVVQNQQNYQSILKRGVEEKNPIDFGDDRNPERKRPRVSGRETFLKSFKVPKLRDDFYLNILDWSPGGLIAVATGAKIYSLSNAFSKFEPIYQEKLENYISSVNFSIYGRMAFGNSLGIVRVYDLESEKVICEQKSHSARVASLGWSFNCVASGSKNGAVTITDLRVKTQVLKYCSHSGEICGLKWNHNHQFIATGSNDTKVVVFDLRKKQQLVKITSHKAAVKGLDWSPHNHSLLASGGGTTDQKLKLFCLKTLQQQHQIDTGSQICNLSFSKISNEIVTTHGFSQNTINVWSLKNSQKSLNQERMLHGHRLRIVYLAMSPEGNLIVTGSGDETVKLWNVFQTKKSSQLQYRSDLR